MRGNVGWTIVLLSAFGALATSVASGQAPPIAERPWCVWSCSSLDRLLKRCDALLASVDRPELSDVLAERYAALQDFQGLDRDRPFGLMWAWTEADPSSAEVLFLPVAQREPLLSLVTMNAVPYRKVSDDRYVIERPGVPYHALFRSEYLWCGDQPAALALFAQRKEALLREMPKDDVALTYDLRQVPPAVRRRWAESWRFELEPLLQKTDSEAPEVYGWRRPIGRALVDLVGLAWEETERLTIGLSLHPEPSDATLEIQLQALPDSELAQRLNRWKSSRSPLLQLDQPLAVSAGFVSLKDLTPTPTPGGAASAEADEWELAWQVFGLPHTVRHTVVVVRQPQLAALSDRAKATVADRVERSGVSFRRVNTPSLPKWLREFVGYDPEIWLGRDPSTLWLGFGPPEAARDALATGLLLTEHEPDTNAPVLAKARFLLRDVVPYLQEYLDPAWAYEQLAAGDDQVEITIASQPNGLRLQVRFDAGILRLVGSALASDLADDLENLLR